MTYHFNIKDNGINGFAIELNGKPIAHTRSHEHALEIVVREKAKLAAGAVPCEECHSPVFDDEAYQNNFGHRLCITCTIASKY